MGWFRTIFYRFKCSIIEMNSMFVAYKFDEGKNTKTKCGVLENFVKQNCLDSGNFREQKTGEIDPKQNFVFALADQISFIQFILQFDEGEKKVEQSNFANLLFVLHPI